MQTETFTDEATHAIYTVRALTINEQQEVVNTTISLLRFIAECKGWTIDPDIADMYGGYPYVVRLKAHEFIALWLTTRIEGTPCHVFPDTLLGAIDPAVFDEWLKFLRLHPDLKNQWSEAFNRVNKESDTPQPASDDELPETA